MTKKLAKKKKKKKKKEILKQEKNNEPACIYLLSDFRVKHKILYQ
jgi:hypothetical protein